MTKKEFNTQEVTSKFFGGMTDETQGKQDKPKKSPGRPKKDKPLRGYRYNLTLDEDLNGFLHQIAWENRTSITQYLNDLIRSDKERFTAEGGKIDPTFETKGGK